MKVYKLSTFYDQIRDVSLHTDYITASKIYAGRTGLMVPISATLLLQQKNDQLSMANGQWAGQNIPQMDNSAFFYNKNR